MPKITLMHRELLENIDAGIEVRWRPNHGGWVALGEEGNVIKVYPTRVVAAARSAGLIDTRSNVIHLTVKGQKELGDDLV